MFRSIFSRAFISHILLAIIIFTILAFVFFTYTTRIIQTQVVGSYERLVSSSSDQIDRIALDMDLLSKDILVTKSMISEPTYNMFAGSYMFGNYRFTSNHLRNLFFWDTTVTEQSQIDYFYLGLNDTLTTIINTVNGSSIRAREILMYDMQGRYISAPFPIDSSIMEEKLTSSKEMIQTLCEKMGSTLLSSPYRSNLYGKEMVLFSFYRSFYGENNDQQKGVIEIQQDFSKVENIIDINFRNLKDVFIFDQAGRRIYPTDASDDNLAFSEQVYRKSNGETHTYLDFSAEHSKTKSALVSVRSHLTGWTIVQLVDNKILYEQVDGFKKWFLMVGGLVLVFGALAALAFANNTTSSVRLLHKTIRNTDLQNLIGQSEHRLISAPKEISDVYVDFREMCKNLDITIKESIDAKTKESEAHWKALQAQMNPHFIFNTLSVISEACDEGENEAASYMCRRLSDMLRYVTRSAETQTTLQKELTYTLDYLSLMQKRYEEHLIYDIDIAEDILETTLPKLVIQPLVENSIRHGFKDSRPPWKVKLIGRVIENGWEFIVQDNGCGMSKERLEEIHTIIQSKSKGIASIENEGIGLISTIERLTLMYKKHFHYRIENVADGGLLVAVAFSEISVNGGERNAV